MRRRVLPAVALAAGWIAATAIPAGTPAVADEPLSVAPGGHVTLACDTHSVMVAPDAASSSGKLRLRLDFAAEAGEHAGTWTVLDAVPQHTASFANRQQTACAAGCELDVSAPTATPPNVLLWAPKRAAPDAIAPNVPLTVVALDPRTLKLSASTFLAKDIAGLEKGTCSRE